MSEHAITYAIYKLKEKIKRKAHVLRRWQNKNGLSSDKAAKGLLRAINRKLYEEDEDGFSWSRWCFPHLTTERGLHIPDETYNIISGIVSLTDTARPIIVSVMNS